MGIHCVNSAETYNKDWTGATIIGSLPHSSSFKYYFEPQLRLIDTTSVFNQLLLLGGLGYQMNPDVLVVMGSGWIRTKTVRNFQTEETRIWEQLNWRMLNTPNWNINSRTRIEQRKHADFSAMSLRLRERIWIRVPFKKWEGYSFSCFDEIFFNLNHPEWTSPYLIEQNRLFVGISRKLSETIIMDAGYANQYIRSSTKFLDNVLLISFNITT